MAPLNDDPLKPLPNALSTIKDLQVLIVTGLSGAGKTSVMRTLEDLGFYCIDNLPVPLIFTFLNLVIQTKTTSLRVALGIDARSQQYLQSFVDEVAKLKRSQPFNQITILFLKASEDILVRRFQETRRNHPLMVGAIDLVSAIKYEARLLEPIMSIADITLDTDSFTIHELRHWVRKSFEKKKSCSMLVNLVSFGFKYGLPTDSNLVFDVRFLPNPYFVEELKPLTGKSPVVQNYVFSQKETEKYWDQLYAFISTTLEKYYEEGRFFVTIAIGCTGGKHRSVAFIEKLGAAHLPNAHVVINHRDIGKE